MFGRATIRLGIGPHSSSFSFRFVDENCRIFVVVVVFVTKINLFSSTKIFVFVVVDEKTLIQSDTK